MLPSKRPVRVYSDTTVFGGIVDLEFAIASRVFFQRVQELHFTLVLSGLVEQEIAAGPKEVQELLDRNLVNFRKIPLYNAVNGMNGYGNIAVYSPLEVIKDDDETF